MALEKIALEDDYFVSRKLYPNVDFYSGIVQKAIGIPVPLFTAIFALARTVGWIAQLNEMIADPEYKIGRPRQLFTGATRRIGEADRASARQRRPRRRAQRCKSLGAPPREATSSGGDMGSMQEFAVDAARCSARNAPFIEELYERYLAEPGQRARRVARVLRRAARRRAATSRTRRSSSRSSSSRKQPQGRAARWSTRRRCTSRCSCCG